MNTSLYKILGVSKNATTAELKTAYRKLMLHWHPDKNKGHEKKATEMSQQINHAYSILSDEQKRKQYDQGLIDSQGNPTNPYSQGFSGGSPFAGSPFGSSGQTFHFTSAGADGIDIEDILKNFGFGGTPHKTQQTRHSAKTPDDFEETFWDQPQAKTRAKSSQTSSEPSKSKPTAPYKLDVEVKQVIKPLDFYKKKKVVVSYLVIEDNVRKQKSLELDFAKLSARNQQKEFQSFTFQTMGNSFHGEKGHLIIHTPFHDQGIFHITKNGQLQIDLLVNMWDALAGKTVRFLCPDGITSLSLPVNTSNGDIIQWKDCFVKIEYAKNNVLSSGENEQVAQISKNHSTNQDVDNWFSENYWEVQ